MSGVEFAHRARRHAEIVDRHGDEMKRRQGDRFASTSLTLACPSRVHLWRRLRPLYFK